MDSQREKAFDFASDLAKQLITLSTGILAITITFTKDIYKLEARNQVPLTILIFAWSVYLLSIISGIWTLMALTGELEQKSELTEIHEPTTKNFNVFLPTSLQIILFLIATFLVILFGAVSNL